MPPRPQAGTSSCETPTPATCSLGHTDTEVWIHRRPHLALAKHVSHARRDVQDSGCLKPSDAPAHRYPQPRRSGCPSPPDGLAGERRPTLGQTREPTLPGHARIGCDPQSRVSGRQGTSGPPHRHPTRTGSCSARTRWAERGGEGWGRGRSHEHMCSGWASPHKAKPCPQLGPQCAARVTDPQPWLVVTAR